MCDDIEPERQGTKCAKPFFDQVAPNESPEEQLARRLLNGLGYCGHYMHFHGGGRSGRAPIICLIAKHDGQMSQQELGSYFELKPGSLSEILTKIEAAGLIERTRNPEDRRQLFIRLTEAGQAEAAREQAARINFRREAFSCLTLQEQEELAVMLEKIRICWEDLND